MCKKSNFVIHMFSPFDHNLHQIWFKSFMVNALTKMVKTSCEFNDFSFSTYITINIIASNFIFFIMQQFVLNFNMSKYLSVRGSILNEFVEYLLKNGLVQKSLLNAYPYRELASNPIIDLHTFPDHF